jgi:PilZ domain
MKNVPSAFERSLPELPPSFDRRRRERIITLAIPLRILSSGFLGEKCDPGICTDLSEGGVAFDCASELSVGEIVILEFQQKGEAAYRCHVRLSYRLGWRYGGYFLTGD